jgi:hypothetical protein
MIAATARVTTIACAATGAAAPPVPAVAVAARAIPCDQPVYFVVLNRDSVRDHRRDIHTLTVCNDGVNERNVTRCMAPARSQEYVPTVVVNEGRDARPPGQARKIARIAPMILRVFLSQSKRLRRRQGGDNWQRVTSQSSICSGGTSTTRPSLHSAIGLPARL